MAVRLGEYVEKSYGRQDINDRYHRYDKILGRGAYKTVYWGWDTAEGVDVAWNCIDLDALPTTEERSKILREVEMLQNLHHKHILRIRNHWENPQTNQLCFITDIVQGGSLREYIRQREVNLLRVKSWCVQILDALQYLHGSSPVIIHRDLKCDNIFIDGPSGNITIGDLGLSTKYASTSLLNNKDKGMSIVGTPEFMAPELYEEQYDEKVDIYSFGMCVLEMISGKYPYEECTNQIQVIRKVTEKKQPDILRRLHRYVRTFIEICIERNPKKRPAAHELLKHPFLSFMDDLKNKWSVSDFVFDEDCTIKHYKDMENKSRHKQHQQQLSIIKETANPALCITESPSPKTNKSIKRTATKKVRTKKKYVTGTTVSVEDGGNISVKLKIHHDKESQKVKFQYAPQTENIQSVVREMVETLDLDRSREVEIVSAIKTKLNDLEGMSESSIPPLRAATQPPQTQTQTQAQPANTRQMKTYSEPPSAKSPHAPHAPLFNDTPQTQPSVFPKVFNANGTTATATAAATATATMPVTALLSMSKRRMSNSSSSNKSHPNMKMSNLNTTQSAPVTPGHSPETEKHFVNKFKAQTGYTSDTCSDFAREQDKTAPKLVSDSLLDQIMALPRETIKGRIVQFGGTFMDEDSTAVLVTKLFQLLSDNTNTNSGKIKSQQNENTVTATATTTVTEEATPALVVQHTNATMAHPTTNIQHIGPSNPGFGGQHLSNLQMNVVKMNGASYHGASTSESVHLSPPNIINPLQRNHNTMQQQCVESPPNELVYPSTNVSAPSPKAMVNHQRSQSYTNPPKLDEVEDEPDELDPNVELPKLRLRQKELMKGKIVYEMKRLKQRNCAQLGRDKTIDTIASELAEVEKQIKVLTDASKSGAGSKMKHKKHNKTLSDSNVLTTAACKVNMEPVQHTPSRHNSSELSKDAPVIAKKNELAQLSIDHNVSAAAMESVTNSGSQSVSLLVDTISSPLVSTAHRDQFECHLQRLSPQLNLREIAFNLDELFTLNEAAVSYDVFQNAKDRITREKKQLEEEYHQYYADQTEMLLLKLQKHRNNPNKLMSETQSTQNKLLSKQDKSRNKFKSIVNDQLQILQLTQELNDEAMAPLPLPQDEFYLYKEEMDKMYLERVKQFEAKQKKEFDSFRTDLRELKHLRLEIRKKHLLKITSTPTSPARSPHKLQFDDKAHNNMPFTLSSSNANATATETRTATAPQHNRRHSQSSSVAHTQQIDILTGLDLKLINDTNDNNLQSNVNETANSRSMHHFHSASLPLIEHNKLNINNTLTPTSATQSKFKVSHVNNPPHTHSSHTHTLPHSNK